MSLGILHVPDHSVPLHSGYAFRTMAILKEQRRLGWETLQLTSTKHCGAEADEEDIDGSHFYRTRVPEGGFRTAAVVGQLAVILDTQDRLEQILAHTRPDVIHAHSPCLIGIAALRAAKRYGLPVVYAMRASWEDTAVDHGTTTEDSPRYRISRRLETWTLKHADAVTTICEGLRKDILSRGLPAELLTVIPNAVNPDELPLIHAPDYELQASLGLQGTFTLGFIGSFYAYDGLDTLMNALPLFLRIELRARLLLVGGAFEEVRLKEQARQLGIGAKVIFTGRVPHAEVSHYCSLMNLLVYPRKSNRLTETVTPLKPLEAMAQGLLLIASDVGGHRELIQDDRTGFLLGPDRPVELTRAVEKVLSSRDRWGRIAKAGRQFVETVRNWRESVARYSAVCQRARQAAGRR